MNTYELVLVGSDGREGSLREDERLALCWINVVESSNHHVRATAADQVNTRLIFVHRVQNYLYTSHVHLQLHCFR